MKKNCFTHAWRGALAIFLATSFSGCIIGSNSRTETTGHQFGATTLAQIQPGKTKDYVTALLGAPTEKTSVPDGPEIWKWQYTEQTETTGQVIFIVNSHNKSQKQKNTYVEFKDNMVAKCWSD